MQGKDSSMIHTDLQDEQEILLGDQDDFREMIFQIYLIHFLVEVFRELQGDKDERREEKIWNMILRLILKPVFMGVQNL